LSGELFEQLGLSGLEELILLGLRVHDPIIGALMPLQPMFTIEADVPRGRLTLLCPLAKVEDTPLAAGVNEGYCQFLLAGRVDELAELTGLGVTAQLAVERQGANLSVPKRNMTGNQTPRV